MENEIIENMPTSELDELLNAELRRDAPDGELVRSILQILEDREVDQPVAITPEIQAAWDKFIARNQGRADRPKPTARSWVIRAMSIAAVVCLLICVMPVRAQAESWVEKLTRWTDSVLEFFIPTEATELHAEYEFKTDNPGLQKVYDAVVELGVTEPVVPMWIPEGYELFEMKVTPLIDKTKLHAYFTNAENNLIFQIDIPKSNVWHEYHKSESDASEYEYSGVKHYIIQNNSRWTIVWEKKNIECWISTGEEDIYRIIKSIYGEGDKT